ncbi:nucleolar protein 12 [Clupea harengus]|uniref:Nucleolar protein 12 n=1 Tax=Clupea harengus TaxID=7950 RepID=A0A6P3VV93_CLUHA|nr:nucleolar protein 12 [Clupea harengus]
MKNMKNGKFNKESKHRPGSKKREPKRIVMFDDKNREEYLTGFHKRKIERRKAAVEEIKQKMKEEQKRVREERHKEYLRMLIERKEALDEADELEDVITGTTESQQYDHPNHTVTVTTISDLDLTRAHLLGGDTNQDEEDNDAEDHTEDNDTSLPKKSLPKKSGNPLLSKKIKSLSSSLNKLNKQSQKKKRKGKQEDKGTGRSNLTGSNNKRSLGRTTKTQRRRQTGGGRNRGNLDRD